MTLSHDALLERLAARHAGPHPEGAFAGVTADDRAVDAIHDLFVAIRGARHDSHSSLEALARAGKIRGAVGEQPRPAELAVPYYRVENSRRALAELAWAFAGDPGRQLRLFGITGTNGKSSTVRLLAAILEAAGRDVGWLGTVTRRTGSGEVASSLTTPEPLELARGLRELLDAGGTDAVLEVSSHALEQQRVAGLAFSGAIFTNLSRDHLDYHRDAQAYLQAKLQLFERVAPGCPAVIPLAGPVSATDPQLRNLQVCTFGESAEADAYPEQLELDQRGMRGVLRVRGQRIPLQTQLLGRHNLANILAAALLASSVGVPSDAIAAALSSAPAVRGRLERVPVPRGEVFVDYAHTPDALEAVLGAVREITNGRLMVLFGCGGDRDRGKRPQMGEVAARLADRVFVTSDNPRGEEPATIVADVVAGMSGAQKTHVEVDRRQAIATALDELHADDVLVVAGKGHETEQLVAGKRLPFDDRRVIEEHAQSSSDPTASATQGKGLTV
ncbi:MAG: UDP-N-acetylmuramoyl-L-alanyl-D-glutamate--2,6-diaminopimelate ligase [Planctomycetota bacterium]